MSLPTELPLSPARIEAMRAALRHADPAADLSVDPGNGQLRIMTSLPSEQVLSVLGRFGSAVEVVEDGQRAHRDGDGCCGCCGG